VRARTCTHAHPHTHTHTKRSGMINKKKWRRPSYKLFHCNGLIPNQGLRKWHDTNGSLHVLCCYLVSVSQQSAEQLSCLLQLSLRMYWFPQLDTLLADWPAWQCLPVSLVELLLASKLLTETGIKRNNMTVITVFKYGCITISVFLTFSL